MFGKLLEPLRYLTISNSRIKWFSFYIPGLITFIFILVYSMVPLKINIFSDKGLLDLIYTYLSVLTGFYIASLSAIATFSNGNLDRLIQGESAKITSFRGGQKRVEELTRRQFLCLLFGYCSMTSIFLLFLSMFARLLEENVKILFLASFHQLIITIFLVFYMFFFFNLIITTLLGLNYLTERMHRS